MLFKEQLLNFVGHSKTLQENNSVMKIDQNKNHASQRKFEEKTKHFKLIHTNSSI